MPMKNKLSNALARLTKLFAPDIQPRMVENRPPTTPDPRPTSNDDITFCCHARHGAFPVRRKFKTRGTSASGYEFVVFQCPAPACGEFVATTKDSRTGQERVLFRGHHYSPRRGRATTTFSPVRTAQFAAQ